MEINQFFILLLINISDEVNTKSTEEKEKKKEKKKKNF